METVIGTDTVIHGAVSSKGSIRVDGKIEGGITEAQAVVIGQTGEVRGDISADSVVIAGKVLGNIAASNLEILSRAFVQGDIKTAALAVSDGATFEGSCVMTRQEKQVIEMALQNPLRER